MVPHGRLVVYAAGMKTILMRPAAQFSPKLLNEMKTENGELIIAQAKVMFAHHRSYPDLAPVRQTYSIDEALRLSSPQVAAAGLDYCI